MPADASRARAALVVVFGLNGVMFGSWASRIPAIRDGVGASNGELGVALGLLAVGALVAMPLAGGLAARRGSRVATRLSFALACASVAVIGAAPSLAVLCLFTLAYGAAQGALDVTMNAHGVTVERALGRPVLSGLHAAFSAGGLTGAGMGALAAGAGLGPATHLALVGVAAAATGISASARLLPAAADAGGVRTPAFVRPPRRLAVLGALAFAGLVVEGAAADWSGIYLRDDLGSSAGVAALGFAAFSLAMVAARLCGDRLVARVGPERLLRGGGALAAAGLGAALLLAHPVAALAGLACVGLGMAGVVPVVFRAAGAVPGIAPGVAVAAVSSVGYLGFLIGPTLIGGASELVGLPAALGGVVALALVVAALAPTAA